MINYQLHHGAHEVWRHDDLGLEVGLLDVVDASDVGQVLWACDVDHLAVGLVHVVVNRGRCGNEVEAKLALEALLDDLHVEKAEEAHAKAKAQSHARLGRPDERRVVHLELLEGVTQVLVLLVVDGEQPGEDHGLSLVVAGAGLCAGTFLVSDGVAGLYEGRVLEARDHVANLTHAKLVKRGLQRALAAHAIMRRWSPFLMEPSKTRTVATTPRYSSK